MSWKPWKEDVAAELKSTVRPKFIVLHPMSMELAISVDSKAQEALSKDSKFVEKLKKVCDTNANAASAKMKTVLTHADKQAEGFTSDASMAGMFLRPIHMEMEKYFDEGCKKIQKDVTELFTAKKKELEVLKKSSLKIDLDLKFDGLEIPQKGGKKLGAVKIPHLDAKLKDIKLQTLKGVLDESIKLTEGLKKALKEVFDDQVEVKAVEKQTAKPGEDQAKEKEGEEATKELDKSNEVAKKLANQHKQKVVGAVEEWKKAAFPLKNADRQIEDWEKNLIGNKQLGIVATQVIHIELKRVKDLSAPLLKTRASISMALKDTSIAKTIDEALEEAGKGSSGWVKRVEMARDWAVKVKAQVEDLEKGLIRSGQQLDAAAKKITEMAAKH
jgi:hypothetical protein